MYALNKEFALDGLVIMSSIMKIYEENIKLTFSCKKIKMCWIQAHWMCFTTEESENEAVRDRKVHVLQNVLLFQKWILIVAYVCCISKQSQLVKSNLSKENADVCELKHISNMWQDKSIESGVSQIKLDSL